MNMMWWRGGLLLVALVMAKPAAAGFTVVQAPKTAAPTPETAMAQIQGQLQVDMMVGVAEVGQRPGAVEKRKGFGRAIPLAAAIAQIVPKNWNTHIDLKRDHAPASWSAGDGGTEWTEVLRRLTLSQGLYASVDWSTQRVSISDGPPASSQLAAAPAAGTTVARGPRFETLKAGQSLSEALTSYVARHGWQLKWLLDQDYVLDVDVPLKSDNVIDAVTYVVRAYQQQGGMQGVVPRFAKGNNVVVIEKMDVRGSDQ